MEIKHLDAPFEVKAVAEDGVFEGYASIFDVVDAGRDVVVPGAFADSLAAHRKAGTSPKMLWQHNPAEPLGVWRHIEEDRKGLHVEGKLLTGEIRRAQEVHALMKAGALDGLSIGYSVIESTRDERTGIRRLLKLDLWEASIVAFPMNEAARIASVKAAFESGTLPTKKDFERFLREAGGLSRKQAKAFLACGYGALCPRDAGTDAQFEETLSFIRATLARITGEHHGT